MDQFSTYNRHTFPYHGQPLWRDGEGRTWAVREAWGDADWEALLGEGVLEMHVALRNSAQSFPAKHDTVVLVPAGEDESMQARHSNLVERVGRQFTVMTKLGPVLTRAYTSVLVPPVPLEDIVLTVDDVFALPPKQGMDTRREAEVPPNATRPPTQSLESKIVAKVFVRLGNRSHGLSTLSYLLPSPELANWTPVSQAVMRMTQSEAQR